MKSKTELLHALVLAACLIVILGSLLIFRPFWGLMDDAAIAYTLVPRMDEGGIFLESWRYAISDIEWGMFRPIYPLVSYFLYKPGLAFAPWVSFAINAALSILLLLGMAHFWSKLLKIHWREILLVNACFFYQYDLLWHPSLQEKIVILAGLLLFICAAWCPRRILFPAFGMLTVVGFLTKASFVIYFGAAFFVLIGRVSTEVKAKRALTFVGLLFVGMVGALAILALGKAASQGSYTTHHYNLSNIWPNLVSFQSAIFLGPLALGALMFLLSRKVVLRAPEICAPWIGVILFLGIFLPWSISGYIQSVIGPLITVLVCQIVYFFSRPRTRQIFFGLCCVLAPIICAYRVPTMYLRLHDLGNIVRDWRSFSSEPLNMPCAEGAGSMRLFLQAAGMAQPQVKYFAALPEDLNGIWMFDDRMCPLPKSLVNAPGCSVEFLYQSIWKRSYRVVRLKC